MKTTLKILSLTLCAAALVAGCATQTGSVLAQDRVYKRVQVSGPDTFHSTYHFTESNGELGFRFYSQGTSQAPCTKGFIKLVKSIESDAVLYLTAYTMTGCVNFRLVFPNGDLSAGYIQRNLGNGEFAPVMEVLADWKRNGISPALIIQR